MSYKNENKAPMELLSPSFLRETAQALGVGEKKHKNSHYLTHPVPITLVIGAVMRHLIQLQEENTDADTGLYHTGLAAAGLQIIDTYIKNPERYGAFDDRRFKLVNTDLGESSCANTDLQINTDQDGNGGNTGVLADSQRRGAGRYLDTIIRHWGPARN